MHELCLSFLLTLLTNFSLFFCYCRDVCMVYNDIMMTFVTENRKVTSAILLPFAKPPSCVTLL